MITSSVGAVCDRQTAKEMVARYHIRALTLVNTEPSWHHGGLCCFRFRKDCQMADISITQQHELSADAARAAAEKVADKLAGEYGLQCRWDGDVLRFERSGVEGTLALGERQAALRIKLGMLMGAFRSTIETKVAESMRKTFAA
jgi:putative polyhydroxyalkanoate system protein